MFLTDAHVQPYVNDSECREELKRALCDLLFKADVALRLIADGRPAGKEPGWGGGKRQLSTAVDRQSEWLESKR